MKTEMDELKKNLHEAITVICKDYETKHLPEFKVPGWYVKKHTGELFYATEVLKLGLYEPGRSIGYEKQNCRPATPSEIESHLRKICDEKGLKAGVKIHSFYDDLTPYCRDSAMEIEDNGHYNEEEDSFQTSMGLRLYCKGKFAEIIPGKKKLLGSKLDARLIIVAFCKYIERGELMEQIKDFLNEYED